VTSNTFLKDQLQNTNSFQGELLTTNQIKECINCLEKKKLKLLRPNVCGLLCFQGELHKDRERICVMFILDKLLSIIMIGSSCHIE
jgi:hypothetical protein